MRQKLKSRRDDGYPIERQMTVAPMFFMHLVCFCYRSELGLCPRDRQLVVCVFAHIYQVICPLNAAEHQLESAVVMHFVKSQQI